MAVEDGLGDALSLTADTHKRAKIAAANELKYMEDNFDGKIFVRPLSETLQCLEGLCLCINKRKRRPTLEIHTVCITRYLWETRELGERRID